VLIGLLIVAAVINNAVKKARDKGKVRK